MRQYSLAYLTASSLTPPQAIDVAAQLGYSHVGLRLWPSVAGGGHQNLLGETRLMRETIARQRDTGVGVADLEVVRINTKFDPRTCLALLDTGAKLSARAVLVIGEDPDQAALAQSFAQLCELGRGFGLTVDLEFLPWTTVPDAKAALRILDAAGRPANAGILVDALHVARSATTLDDLAALPRDHLHYAQICDGPAGSEFTAPEIVHAARFERLLPGEGGIALKALFDALPPDLLVSVEIPNQIRMAQLGALEWARQALATSRSVLEPRA